MKTTTPIKLEMRDHLGVDYELALKPAGKTKAGNQIFRSCDNQGVRKLWVRRTDGKIYAYRP